MEAQEVEGGQTTDKLKRQVQRIEQVRRDVRVLQCRETLQELLDM
jgi:hypothetical protein